EHHINDTSFEIHLERSRRGAVAAQEPQVARIGDVDDAQSRITGERVKPVTIHLEDICLRDGPLRSPVVTVPRAGVLSCAINRDITIARRAIPRCRTRHVGDESPARVSPWTVLTRTGDESQQADESYRPL